MAASDPVAVRTEGAGRITILWLHGWLATGGIFDDAVRAAERLLPGARHERPDLPGAAEGSEGDPLAQLVGGVRTALDDRGVAPDAVVGHSLGGLVAVHLAAALDRPPRALLLLAPVPPDGLPLPREVLERFEALCDDRSDLPAFLEPQVADRSAARTVERGAARVPPPTARLHLRAFARSHPRPRLPDGVRKVVAVAGARDPYLPPPVLERAFAPYGEAARCEAWEAVGHYPPVEAPQRTAARLADLVGTMETEA